MVEAVVIFLLLIGSAAEAATIGPGSGSVLTNPPTGWFAASTSLEVYRIPTELAAGTYSVGSFSFHNVTQGATPSTPGTVVPFLAVLTNPGNPDDPSGYEFQRSYQTIWVGPSVAVDNVASIDDAINVVTTPYPAGAQQFSWPANTAVYAGLYTIGTARVAYQIAPADTSIGRIDRDTSFTAPTAAGQAMAGFSERFYARYYAFHIDVEPSSGLPPVPGDFDGDRDVDGADFVVWQTNFPSPSGKTLATGDADADGDVDGADFVVWQTNFPTTPAAGAAPVPEPAAWMMALFVFGGMALHVRRGCW